MLTQRDLPNWGRSAAPQMTNRLLQMLAAMHGQIRKASQIGQSLGLSCHTMNYYLDAIRRYLISKTSRSAGSEMRASCNLDWLLDRLKE